MFHRVCEEREQLQAFTSGLLLRFDRSFVRGLVCMCTALDSMSVVCVKTAECDNDNVIRVRMSRERLMNTGFGIGGMARGAY